MATDYANYWEKVKEEAEGFVNTYWHDLKENAMDGTYNRQKSPMEITFDNLMSHLDSIDINFWESYDILRQCKTEANDTSMWEGQEPKQAICTMAFWTYYGEVSNEIHQTIEAKLNELGEEMEAKAEALDKQETELEEKIEKAEEQLEKLQDEKDSYESDVPADLNVNIDAKEKDIEQLNEQLSELQDKIADLTNELDNVQNAIHKL